MLAESGAIAPLLGRYHYQVNLPWLAIAKYQNKSSELLVL